MELCLIHCQATPQWFSSQCKSLKPASGQLYYTIMFMILRACFESKIAPAIWSFLTYPWFGSHDWTFQKLPCFYFGSLKVSTRPTFLGRPILPQQYFLRLVAELPDLSPASHDFAPILLSNLDHIGWDGCFTTPKASAAIFK